MTALRGARWTGRLAQASRLPEARPGAEPFPSGRGETAVERRRRARYAMRAPRLASAEMDAPSALRPPQASGVSAPREGGVMPLHLSPAGRGRRAQQARAG